MHKLGVCRTCGNATNVRVGRYGSITVGFFRVGEPEPGLADLVKVHAQVQKTVK